MSRVGRPRKEDAKTKRLHGLRVTPAFKKQIDDLAENPLNPYNNVSQIMDAFFHDEVDKYSEVYSLIGIKKVCDIVSGIVSCNGKMDWNITFALANCNEELESSFDDWFYFSELEDFASNCDSFTLIDINKMPDERRENIIDNIGIDINTRYLFEPQIHLNMKEKDLVVVVDTRNFTAEPPECIKESLEQWRQEYYQS